MFDVQCSMLDVLHQTGKMPVLPSFLRAETYVRLSLLHQKYGGIYETAERLSRRCATKFPQFPVSSLASPFTHSRIRALFLRIPELLRHPSPLQVPHFQRVPGAIHSTFF